MVRLDNDDSLIKWESFISLTFPLSYQLKIDRGRGSQKCEKEKTVDWISSHNEMEKETKRNDREQKNAFRESQEQYICIAPLW